MDKKALIKELQKDWKRYWALKWFEENGWKRRQCKKCGKFFWSLSEQELCNDALCRPYEFLGNPLTKGKFDYFQAWDAIRKFFEDRGHFHLERYPTVCRWFPLYFNIAAIVNFYRMEGNRFVFEFPKSPIIMLQPSLRFNDIPQVGISGRHWTCHSHVEQAGIWDGKKGYWKDKTIELDFELLTKVFGIKPEKINFIEDVWLGAGAFGYSLEYHIAGLEIGNAVFTEFSGTPDNYTVMKNKVVDMGAGLERFCWLSQGTPTSYEAAMGPVLDKMKEKSAVKYDKDFFLNFSKLSGVLDLEEVENIENEKMKIAKQLGVDVIEMQNKIEPIQAIYAIADHARALQFAIADNGLPSNMGGGYNLRVILRRSLGYIDKYGFPFDLIWVAEKIGKYFKKLHPELLENMENFKKIIKVEEDRYRGSMRRIKQTISTMIERDEAFTEGKIIELYDSHGITPELISEVAAKHNINIPIPTEFYAKVTERHMKEKEEKKKELIDVKGLSETGKLYYEDEKMFEFTAKVLKVEGNRVVLDRTAFYPRGGGQEPDQGYIKNSRIFDVEIVNGVIVHEVGEVGFKEGDEVECTVDKERRRQITQHHSATHLISAAARKLIGPWLWQAGSKKDVDKAHIDMTHYESLSEEEVDKIERLANEMVKKGIKVEKRFMNRQEAERRFGFTIYQGAPVPSSKLRICSIGDIENEACGGTHVDNTSEIGTIIISKVERPADGTVRFVYMAGKAAEKFLKEREETLRLSAELLGVKEEEVPKAVEELFKEWKKKKKQVTKIRERKAKEKIGDLKFTKSKGLKIIVEKIKGASALQLQEISKQMSADDTVIVLFGTEDGKISVFASAGKEAVEKGIDASVIVVGACADLGGRGGGRPNLAQGTGTEIRDLEDVIKRIRKELIE
ncbi:MAG: alanine--tRNA ligase [Candidatus Aenigmatarchaeota archaeon]